MTIFAGKRIQQIYCLHVLCMGRVYHSIVVTVAPDYYSTWLWGVFDIAPGVVSRLGDSVVSYVRDNCDSSLICEIGKQGVIVIFCKGVLIWIWIIIGRVIVLEIVMYQFRILNFSFVFLSFCYFWLFCLLGRKVKNL